jgi:hypothetical protein
MESLDDNVEEMLGKIDVFSKDCLPYFEGLDGKSVEDYLSPEFQALKEKLQQVRKLLARISSEKKQLPSRIQRNTRKRLSSEGLEKDLEKINSAAENLEKIKELAQNFDRFQGRIGEEILAGRAAVPQQFAMIGSLENYAPKPNDEKFLVATHGLAPCVGVALYCSARKTGMVGHLDATHNEESALNSYFDELLDAMQLEEGVKVKAAIVISSSQHYGLDVRINTALNNKQDRISSVKEIRVNNSAACLLLNLQNGNIVTDYAERAFVPGGPLAETLNIPEHFKLFHLRDGKIHEQAISDQSITYEVDDSNTMVPQDSRSQSLSDRLQAIRGTESLQNTTAEGSVFMLSQYHASHSSGEKDPSDPEPDPDFTEKPLF